MKKLGISVLALVVGLSVWSYTALGVGKTTARVVPAVMAQTDECCAASAAVAKEGCGTSCDAEQAAAAGGCPFSGQAAGECPYLHQTEAKVAVNSSQ